jgi:hypothetical protein
MKRGDQVKVQGHVLTVQDGIATVEFAGTYPDSGQRIRIAVAAVDPEDITDTQAAIRELAMRPVFLSNADLARMRGAGEQR